MWINPIDAQARGIRHGDTVRVFRIMEKCWIAAKVTPRICCTTAIGKVRGSKRICLVTGSITGGSINILTPHRPSPLAKGNPSHNNCSIEKV
ncbi:molybdopterin dinucleotide binding domain-containing protein [Escherichia coli]